jgi:hypothetical protein
MSLVCGIDYSTHAIDLVFIDQDDQHSPVWKRYDLDGQDAFDRTRKVAEAMPPRFSTQWDDVIAVGIEHPAGKFGTGTMMRVQGAVLSMLPADVLVQPWAPASWRKAVGLKGNSSKAEIAATVWRDHYTNPDWLQDAFDAFCIALATRQALVPA